MTKKEHIIQGLNKAVSYQTYRHNIEDLVHKGLTTGPNQSEEMAQYTKLNSFRMKRIDKQFTLPEEVVADLAFLEQKQTWLVLTEAWCGDAGQIIPIMSKIAGASHGKIDLKLILRDKNPELMDYFLTNKGRSIPKLISLDQENNVLGSWGPRPAHAQELYSSLRNAEDKIPYVIINEEMQNWYNKNAGKDTLNELLTFIHRTNETPAQV